VPYDFAQERVALEALYNATGGEHWSDSPANGWLGPCHCRWVGVFCINPKACDDSPVYVIGRQHDLTGVLPSWNGDPGQGALPQLQQLYLTENPGLTGTLPETWGNMTKIMYLDLVTNNLDGSLPESWGGMTKMMHLYLRNNHLDGSLPASWGNMTKMFDLYLNNNLLDGTLPASWGPGMRLNMQTLRLQYNHITGTLPPSWSQWNQLATLDISSNRLVGTLPPPWANTSSPYVSFLSLRNNSLSGTLPSACRACTTSASSTSTPTDSPAPSPRPGEAAVAAVGARSHHQASRAVFYQHRPTSRTSR
jgi:hypothetical protein